MVQERVITANHGIGFVISAATGKVLDYEVISKVCNTCIQKKSSLNEQDFEQWAENHNCMGRFGGSSPSMEMECAKRLWARSQELLYYSGIPISRTSRGNANWFEKSGVREIEGGIKLCLIGRVLFDYE